MNRADSTFDEYTLAAFMAGSLSAERRQEVLTYLAENAEARELLALAQQALETAEDDTPLPFEVPPVPQAKPEPVAAPIAPAHDRGPRVQDRSARRFTWKRMSRYAGVFVVVFALGATLRLLIGPEATEGPVMRDAAETLALAPTVEQDLTLQWNAIEDAYQYEIVIFDVSASEVVAEHETKNNRLDSDDAFVVDLKSKLTPGGTYSLRIDAVNAQNRSLTSKTIDFTAPQ